MKHILLGSGILAVLLAVCVFCSSTTRRAAAQTGKAVEAAQRLCMQSRQEQAQRAADRALSEWKKQLPVLQLSQQHERLQQVLLDLRELADTREGSDFLALCHRLTDQLQAMEREERLLPENIF